VKRKIVFFCSLPSFNTGMPISTYKLAAELVKTGRYDVYAVLPGGGELTERLRLAGVNVKIIPFSRLRANPLSMIKFLLMWFTAGFSFHRFIRKNKIDIVHFSDIIDAPFYPWARISRARVVAHARVCAGRQFTRFIFKHWAFLFTSHIVTISHFVKSYYDFHKRAGVVYNPGPNRELFNIDKYPQVICNGADPPPVVLFAAMFRRDKGHHNFLKIASLIKERVDNNVRFVIIGGKVQGHEDYYDDMMKEAKRLNIDNSLTVTGNIPHEEVPSIMANAAVFMLVPDWEEALGGVILEAMSLGVPVVAFDKGGIRECFTDSVSGFLVPHGDFAAAAAAAARLLASSDMRNLVAIEARRELDSKFTIDLHINNIEKIYNSLYKQSETVPQTNEKDAL